MAMGSIMKLGELFFVKLPVLLFTHPIRAILVIAVFVWWIKWWNDQCGGKQK
jgi:hypothetical protein